MTYPSELNKLRIFVDLDDLFDSNTNDQLLEWVNAYATHKLTQREAHRRRNKLMAAFAKVARETLGTDELEALKRRAEE